MNDAEPAAAVEEHRTAGARTLTGGAGASPLKPAELRGTLTAGRSARWSEPKSAHVRTLAPGGPDEAAPPRAVAAPALLAGRVAAVEPAPHRTAGPRRRTAGPGGPPDQGTGP
ncbi:hypothetical protein [Streptomyces sp. NPDC016626]|uniref:hypothetical protein n=1 Tax=Streptomyces sp. NPDC016626 TaxID=3364968 RepID=UPI0036F7DBEB